MPEKNITIKETPHIVDDRFFDVIGSEFRDHVKGMAEWLKNSADAYISQNTPSSQQYIIFRINDGVDEPTIECIDFVGVGEENIEKAFKRWGDPTASKRGKNIKTYGGHGNGGKFYMRNAFERSLFITYKKGVLNVFGFSENKKYGYDERYKNKEMEPVAAMKFAEIDKLPNIEHLKQEITRGERGFTVVRGINPINLVKNKFKITKEMDRLKDFPQSRRILKQSSVSVIYNGKIFFEALRPEELAPYEKFEGPRIVPAPETLSFKNEKERATIILANKKYPAGKLILRTSKEQLASGSLKELNRIDIFGEVGVIGSYQLQEMGVTSYPYAAFIYGEFCPATENDATILEDPEDDCVSNSRDKLVVNDKTKALIGWIAEQVDTLANEIKGVEQEKQKLNQKEINSKFNDVLNEWKNKHMGKIMSSIFSSGSSEGTGGSGDGEGFLGKVVTIPENGFAFKFKQADIQCDTTSNITLKVSVPEALPIGSAIFISLSSEDGLLLEKTTYYIKSDLLKATPEGNEVAFVNIGVTGLKAGTQTTLKAKAGKLEDQIILSVVEKKGNKSGKSFPKVLLSSHDIDPLGTATLLLNDREPVVYQRPQDVMHGIYWINTSNPMASKIYDHFGFDSIQWRNFLFERYINIFTKEAIYNLEKQDPQGFNADSVDQKITEVIKKVHESAKDELDQFLFDEYYKTA